MDVKLGQVLEDWLRWCEPTVKRTTWSRYECYVRSHIGPSLGDVAVSELSTRALDEWIGRKLEAGNLRTGGPLSPKTVNCLLSVIKLALGYAADLGLEVPEVRIHYARERTAPIQILTADEQARLEEAVLASGRSCSLGILISLYTGLRIGEVCGLKWGDVDLDAGLLTVRRTVMRIAAREPEQENETAGEPGARTCIHLSTPKTDSSYRTIPIPAFLAAALSPHRQAADRYVLSASSQPTEPRVFYAHYRRLLTRAGLAAHNYHALRHTFASRCIEYGCDAKSLSEILGHADVSITLKRYVHPSMAQKRLVVERMVAGFRGE